MQKTKQGLPNTCSRCGQPAGAEWWAASTDHALAGQGLCDKCAGVGQQAAEPAKKPAAKKPARGGRRVTKK